MALSTTLLAASLASAEGGSFNPFEFAPGATIWTLVVFVAALPFMIKFVFGPITKSLSDRDDKVEQAAVAAEEARRKAEEAEKRAEAALEESRQEARQRVQEAIDRAQRQAQEEISKARAEIERERQKASQDIEAAKGRALAEIRKEVVDLSIASAGRILNQNLDTEQNRKLVDDLLGAPQN